MKEASLARLQKGRVECFLCNKPRRAEIEKFTESKLKAETQEKNPLATAFKRKIEQKKQVGES
ncbi:PREDICTED: thymosin beta-4-like [Chrysochloris asiatica]|uniref:Thymosin beta-4-like n=1 Tax=Chrysochloris asiatica TaxID=185453 RepID=A0A9B0WX88_CHRAS|nr:PREDICTED: thymosin beta-4-like [Chrysochloris asiatica]